MLRNQFFENEKKMDFDTQMGPQSWSVPYAKEYMAHSKTGDPSECQNPFIFILKEFVSQHVRFPFGT